MREVRHRTDTLSTEPYVASRSDERACAIQARPTSAKEPALTDDHSTVAAVTTHAFAEPAPMLCAISKSQDEAVEADVWMVEGLDSQAACGRIVAMAWRYGRANVVGQHHDLYACAFASCEQFGTRAGLRYSRAPGFPPLRSLLQ